MTKSVPPHGTLIPSLSTEREPLLLIYDANIDPVRSTQIVIYIPFGASFWMLSGPEPIPPPPVRTGAQIVRDTILNSQPSESSRERALLDYEKRMAAIRKLTHPSGLGDVRA